MAQQLWFLRHGEAEPHAAGGSDDARDLTERGREQSRAAGLALQVLDVAFQYVFTSPKVRAHDTATIACEALGCEPVVHPPLREGFDVREATALLLAAGEDRRVLLVGHEPDFSQVIHDLTGARIDLKKGGVAGVRMENTSKGELVALLRPRELDRLAASSSPAV
jgi:phosphohistidine phosphatase